MSNRLSRRTFLQVTVGASSAIIVGFDPQARSWIVEGQAQPKQLQKVPKLDGTLLFDEASLSAAATDGGKIVRRMPAAVLRPGSVQDIVRMVQYANQHALKIAMRGQGHSVYGQAQVEAGIVIDSGTLKAVQFAGAESADVQPGASWGEVNQVTLAKGLTPPVMPDTMTITVGGNLSNGGMGITCHHFGAVVDNAEELDVVTGDGHLVTCSPQQQSEIFNMMLAGLGQCGLIVRGRMRLVPASSHVAMQDLFYDDLETFLSDLQRLAVEGHVDHVQGRIEKMGDAGKFTIIVGKFYNPPDTPDLAQWQAGLRSSTRSEPVQTSYRDFLYKRTRRATQATGAPFRPGTPVQEIAMWVPASTARDFVGSILATPSDLANAPGLGVWPLITHRFTRPLFKMPSEDLAYGLWILDKTDPNDAPAVAAMLATHRSLYERMHVVGGKRYAGFGAVPFAPADWKDHFGPKTWQRLVAAKQQYDPNNVLTPGPAMFTSRS